MIKLDGKILMITKLKYIFIFDNDLYTLSS